ncbi:pyrroloquinoline quinone biosynthesis peptide chaperone PqqD [Bartonella sp. HY406]|uniref:pyrroloquinoline quinone biosynthesis peptide chaperone PqqD n=1 Tax=Bartonella sp. HY406 TaxID=2979331 RepID=UPI0021C8CDCD|nr:pyrroloquinoline quinone biosynthesis peptide chaperone PqqD [Bartonella sp. HY406]UXN04134.1 pyrroloquinoline quinone biosynthesis peptide chaperone PqqD [Bartonella sp. HY406]
MLHVLAEVKKSRQVVNAMSKPQLMAHVRMRYDPVREALALLSPEKILWPDEIALEILNLCNGKNTVSDITTKLANQYEAPLDEVIADVMEFLQSWSDQLLLKL